MYLWFIYDAANEFTGLTDSNSTTLLQQVYDNLGRLSSISRTSGPSESRGVLWALGAVWEWHTRRIHRACDHRNQALPGDCMGGGVRVRQPNFLEPGAVPGL
jgi:YD repeat-containing protein